MARLEYGPKNVQPNKNAFVERTRFTSVQLREIDTQSSSYLETHPESSRDDLVSRFTKGEKQAERFQKGLDILNQLVVFESDDFDPIQNVNTIIVREDTSSPIQIEPLKGKNHQYYEIDWAKNPVEKQKPKPESKPQASTKPDQPTYPFISRTPDTLRRGDDEFRERRESRRDRQRKEEERRSSKKTADAVILDEAREIGEKTMALGMLKVELGEDGKAKMLYARTLRTKPDGTYNFMQIDRETGALITDDPMYRYEGIRLDTLRYYEAHARALEEGNEVDYQPLPLHENEIAWIYHRAISEGFLQVVTGPDGTVGFTYEADSYFGRSYSRVDLEQGVLVNTLGILSSKPKRPLRPQFVTHLKAVKTSLEQSLTNKPQGLNR